MTLPELEALTGAQRASAADSCRRWWRVRGNAWRADAADTHGEQVVELPRLVLQELRWWRDFLQHWQGSLCEQTGGGSSRAD
jgi:hypothetical protein